MIDQIRDTFNGKTTGTYMLILCSLGITIAAMLFPNLQNVYGLFHSEAELKFFTYLFYHGFDEGSSMIHLMLNITLLIMIGNFCEKIMGRFVFLVHMTAVATIYALILRQTDIWHLAATGYTFSLFPVVQYALYESRRIKTRSIYDDHYRLLKLLTIIALIVVPIINIFLQFFLRGNIPYSEAAYHGLMPFAVAYGIGIVGMLVVRPFVKRKLRVFHKKKKFVESNLDKAAGFVIYLMPAYLLVIFLAS